MNEPIHNLPSKAIISPKLDWVQNELKIKHLPFFSELNLYNIHKIIAPFPSRINNE